MTSNLKSHNLNFHFCLFPLNMHHIYCIFLCYEKAKQAKHCYENSEYNHSNDQLLSYYFCNFHKCSKKVGNPITFKH